MLSGKDYLDYLKQMERVESDMRDTYKACAEKYDDKRISAILAELSREETRHAIMVKELEKIFSKEEKS